MSDTPNKLVASADAVYAPMESERIGFVRSENGVTHVYDVTGSKLATISRAPKQPMEGVTFVTESDNNLQLARIGHRAGGVVPRHIHNPITRTLQTTQEVLIVMRGALLIDFYDTALQWVYDTRLESGDAVALIRGGHGLNMIEDCEILEVKQGPYAGAEKDKQRF